MTKLERWLIALVLFLTVMWITTLSLMDDIRVDRDMWVIRAEYCESKKPTQRNLSGEDVIIYPSLKL